LYFIFLGSCRGSGFVQKFDIWLTAISIPNFYFLNP
jgi:hypothetical protein